MNTPFDITKEEVLNLAAQKLADSFSGESDLWEKAESLVEQRVGDLVAKGLKEKVDAVLTKEITELLSKEIVPVDIWGEKAGAATTIRAELHERAKNFWQTKIGDDGREYSYGTPRHEVLMKQIMKDEFSKAVKENSEAIVSAFKTSLKEHTIALVSQHIDSLIRVK